MNRALARTRNMLMALAVVLMGTVVLASPASAHQGTVSVQTTTCLDGDTVRVTYQVTWANVPVAAQNTHVFTRTGTATFNSAWDDSSANAAAWATTDRGAVGSAAGTRSWSVNIDKAAFGGTGSASGPWEYAYFPWTNGNTGSRFHDSRVEGFDWNLCVQVPEGFEICHATGVTPSTTTIEAVRKYEINRPSGSGQLSGHVGPGHQNGLDIIPPIPGYLPNGQNWTLYGQEVYHGIGGAHCEVPRTDATAGVSVGDPTCAAASPVTFTPTFATASPATPDLTPGQHSVTFTSTDGHRFADGSRTRTVSYTVPDRLNQDLDACAARDAVAGVTVGDPSCAAVSPVLFNATNATSSPATPNLAPGQHSVTFTATNGHRFADGGRTKTVSYTVLDKISADADTCAATDASAAVDLVSAESCTGPSVVQFSMAHAAASPVAPQTQTGTYSVTFTADSGHRFANGERTRTVSYTIAPALSADHQDCAARDAFASVDLVSAESCTGPSVVGFTAAHATPDPAAPATTVGDHSVTFTADSGHRFPNGERTRTVGYSIVDQLPADHQECAVRDASAAVDLVSAESCTGPSVVQFSMAHATASPVAPQTQTGTYSVTFTADSGHRFPNGERTRTVGYSIVDQLPADHQDCAVRDASAAVDLVSADSCTGPSVVWFSMAHATADPAAPATTVGDHLVTFTADSGHRFATGSRTQTVPYSITDRLSADDDACAVRDAGAGVELVSHETCTDPSVVSFSMANATADPAAPATEPGDHSVTFTADADHRFADGSRELTLDYTIAPAMGADDDQCAVHDAAAAVSTTDPTCLDGETLVLGSTTSAAWGLPSLTEGPGDYTVAATADSGHRFAEGARTLELVGTLDGPIPADDPRCLEVEGVQTQILKHQLQASIEVHGQQVPIPTVVDAGADAEAVPLGSGGDRLWLLAVGGGLTLLGFAGGRRRQGADR